MFATAVIVFRETLEAALIVSIVLAATRGVAGRRRWVGGGVAAGIAGALVIAALTEAIEKRNLAAAKVGSFDGDFGEFFAREVKHVLSGTYRSSTIAETFRP